MRWIIAIASIILVGAGGHALFGHLKEKRWRETEVRCLTLMMDAYTADSRRREEYIKLKPKQTLDGEFNIGSVSQWKVRRILDGTRFEAVPDERFQFRTPPEGPFTFRLAEVRAIGTETQATRRLAALLDPGIDWSVAIEFDDPRSPRKDANGCYVVYTWGMDGMTNAELIAYGRAERDLSDGVGRYSSTLDTAEICGALRKSLRD
ncbi:MAG TPA: hypothetical protein VD997_17575 [Phycisphaerales bacterium]|nr:hypothetical protein [Phycisphaerales bacterium]